MIHFDRLNLFWLSYSNKHKHLSCKLKKYSLASMLDLRVTNVSLRLIKILESGCVNCRI